MELMRRVTAVVKVSREAFRARFVVVEARAREARTNGCLEPLGDGDREANHVIWYRLDCTIQNANR